jgi:hypothetical protein
VQTHKIGQWQSPLKKDLAPDRVVLHITLQVGKNQSEKGHIKITNLLQAVKDLQDFLYGRT